MPLTIITISKVKNSLRGDLTKWMQEIDTGVYVGNFNSKVRENLWQRIIDNIGDGSATMTYAYRNEIGYTFKTHNTNRNLLDVDGIPLVLVRSDNKKEVKIKHGFSKQAKHRKARSYQGKTQAKKFVVVDIETSGLDYEKHKIIEIGAVLTNSQGEVLDKFESLIKQEIKLSNDIIKLTGITDEDLKNGRCEKQALEDFLSFIKNYPIVGYNFNFDMKFLNYNLEKNSLKEITNTSYDLKTYVKREKMFLKNYKLETVLKEYGIKNKVDHRALADALVTVDLASQVNEFLKKL